MRITRTLALVMISLEETGGACLTLMSLSGFSSFAGSRFFDDFWSDFFALAGLGIWEREEILVTGVTPITLLITSWTRTSSSLGPTFRLQSSPRPSFISSNFCLCSSLQARWQRRATRSPMSTQTTTMAATMQPSTSTRSSPGPISVLLPSRAAVRMNI